MPWSNSSSQSPRPAPPRTPSVPLGFILLPRVLVLGCTTVIIHLEQGTGLPELIAKIIDTAKDSILELSFYTMDCFEL